jgi:hypothetical protein
MGRGGGGIDTTVRIRGYQRRLTPVVIHPAVTLRWINSCFIMSQKTWSCEPGQRQSAMP